METYPKLPMSFSLLSNRKKKKNEENASNVSRVEFPIRFTFSSLHLSPCLTTSPIEPLIAIFSFFIKPVRGLLIESI